MVIGYRIKQKFKELRQEGKKALVSFLTAGFPDMASSREILGRLAEWGVDLVEIGLPFSDPIADGPTIQYSSQQALAQGVSFSQVYSLGKYLRRQGIEIPLVVMSYANPLFRRSLARFSSEAQSAGFDGIIVPDLPLEESREFRSLFNRSGLALIPFLAPTTPKERMERIIRSAQGFIYVVSVTGVTGSRRRFSPELKEFLCRVRQETDKPLLLGFGVSSAEQIRPLLPLIDGVIVGSALIEIIKNSKKSGRERAVAEFLGRLRQVLG